MDTLCCHIDFRNYNMDPVYSIARFFHVPVTFQTLRTKFFLHKDVKNTCNKAAFFLCSCIPLVCLTAHYGLYKLYVRTQPIV
jgi:hypothetical protein